MSNNQTNNVSEAENTKEPAVQDGFKVILASGSPRRASLLSDANVVFSVRKPTSPVDETLDADTLIDPVEAAKKLAEKKAGAVVQEILAENPSGNFIVIGADTMVVYDNEIFGKPKNLDDAKRMLRALSGNTHEVITAVSLWMIMAPDAENISLAYRTLADMSKVTFKEITDDQIADYLRKGESFDKAGAYAIQGEGAALVDHYDGNLDTIVGLPVQRLLKEFPDLQHAS